MQTGLHERLVATAAVVCVLLSCDSQQKAPTKAHAAATAETTLAATANEPAAESAPTGCKASGVTPVKLGNTVGNVLGFAGDATHLYYVSWQLYGSRGNLGKVRKDGGGADTLASLALEPRSLVMDDHDLYYSQGIRLMKIAKSGGTPTTIAPQFSSLSLAIDANYVYGVPCDYGPYDRLVRVSKTGGVNYELDVATRPESKTGPVGYSAIAVDGSGVYVTDSGRHQVLRFRLERGKPKALATGQPKAFDLATDSTNLYFTLADKGQLMLVPKAGGAVKKLATGLVPKSRIAADDGGAVATFAGENESAGTEIAIVTRDGGARRKLAVVASPHSVEAVALDKDCVYWVDRTTGSGAVEFYAVARQ
jgi:hypothetical protein